VGVASITQNDVVGGQKTILEEMKSIFYFFICHNTTLQLITTLKRSNTDWYTGPQIFAFIKVSRPHLLISCVSTCRY